MAFNRNGEYSHLPFSSLLLGVSTQGPQPVPKYSEGLYYNRHFKRFPNEVDLVELHAAREAIPVQRLLQALNVKNQDPKTYIQQIKRDFFMKPEQAKINDDLTPFFCEMAGGFELELEGLYNVRQDNLSRLL